jgi:hypothetical protein
MILISGAPCAPVRPIKLIALVLLLGLLPISSARAQATSASAPDNQNPIISFLEQWDERALRAQQDQPNWLTPVATSTARLKQEIRYDITWQRNPDGSTTENYGGSRGFTTIPFSRVEISVNLPPYVVHNEPKSHDGFGDFSVLSKFRIASANRSHGDYALTMFLNITFPTGSYKNGSPHPVITPTFAAGKGFGDFVYQGTLGADLPGEQANTLGRRLILNNALQYRGLGKIWPELEVNSNFYNQGPNDGKNQTFLTPGISAGRFPLYKNLRLTAAAGVEIAVTHFHTSTHQTIFSLRLPF